MQELFRKVQPQQCLGSVWSRRSSGACGRQNGGRAPAAGGGGGAAGCDGTVASVSATVDQFNAVTHRVIASIVGHATSPAGASTSQRARVVDKWIDIAQVRPSVRHLLAAL